eukprot:402641-Amphidinium_carterae.1
MTIPLLASGGSESIVPSGSVIFPLIGLLANLFGGVCAYLNPNEGDYATTADQPSGQIGDVKWQPGGCRCCSAAGLCPPPAMMPSAAAGFLKDMQA